MSPNVTLAERKCDIDVTNEPRRLGTEESDSKEIGQRRLDYYGTIR